MSKRRRSTGPSSLLYFQARGKNTTLINIEKTTVSSNFMTQSPSGLKCTLASFFKPSHRCGGETRKSNSSSYRPASLLYFQARGKNTTLINIEKTTVSSNFITQSLSGLKCTLASFFKPSQPCGGETTKSNSSSYRPASFTYF